MSEPYDEPVLPLWTFFLADGSEHTFASDEDLRQAFPEGEELGELARRAIALRDADEAGEIPDGGDEGQLEDSGAPATLVFNQEKNKSVAVGTDCQDFVAWQPYFVTVPGPRSLQLRRKRCPTAGSRPVSKNPIDIAVLQPKKEVFDLRSWGGVALSGRLI